MKAIVPLNIAAVRVSNADQTNVTGKFKGAVAAFNNLPYDDGLQHNTMEASTGDKVVEPLESDTSPQHTLGTGIHLHWELPDYFRRGVQPPVLGEDVVFPPTPNRFLVIRHISVLQNDQYGPIRSKAWIVESDYVASTRSAIRPMISVPLPSVQKMPFQYMGRVLDYDAWNPASESPSQFLPAYQGPDRKALYLTSTGFVGPGFSTYYPECCSVFGFWDHFQDLQDVGGAITNATPIQFKVSYQIIGWVNEPADDPLKGFADEVMQQYVAYVAQCISEGVAATRTPEELFASLALQKFDWTFHEKGIAFTPGTLSAPDRTICAGLIQEIVWNEGQGPTYFLANMVNSEPEPVWTDTVELAVGNTTIEALSALLKKDVGNTSVDPDVLKNYEYLLDALQLGLLHGLEQQSNKIIALEEALHAKGFGRVSGGLLWVIQRTPTGDADAEVALPLDLAEELSLLNQAQKTYDQARAALDMRRKQLFMDWLRYVKLYVPYKFSGEEPRNFTMKAIEDFVSTSTKGVTAVGKEEAGVLQYTQDPVTSEITGLDLLAPPVSGTLADAVWQKAQKLKTTLKKDFQLRTVPAPPFWMPTDPVLLMEGKRMEPARRNGATSNIAVRLSGEVLSKLTLQYGGNSFAVNIRDLAVPVVSAATPMQADIQALVGEAFLLVPMLTAALADALQGQGGSNNPAVDNRAGLIASLQSAQGGLSPLEGTSTGLFATLRQDGYVPVANPVQNVTAPLSIAVTFTNATATAWPPDPVGWSAQTALPKFSASRYDPFLPVYMIWTIRFDPLKRKNGQSYSTDNLTDYFSLDSDAVDYEYQPPATFTLGTAVEYDSSIMLSRRAAVSLTRQIDLYVKNYPNDQADPTLEKVKTAYQKRKFLAQALGGFNIEQTLRKFIPQIKVEDLPINYDAITKHLDQAALATQGDNWYDFAFNSQTALDTGFFGPLRSGFLTVESLEIVDVFGQRMQLSTQSQGNTLQVTPALSLQPASTDTANQGKVYLPPRLLVPTRLWFRWLSAAHNNNVPGISSDFVEMNTHPATSPICGWVVPNHLDNSLFFYEPAGTPIGSFGIEHGSLKYRTRAGNTRNNDDLETDIGPVGSPTVNVHLANFMWSLDGRTGGFLSDLMAAILASDTFINPANFAQDAVLAVLIGRPLALTRAVLGIETAGNLLPLSQADTDRTDPFPQDINNKRYDYAQRQDHSSAALGSVRFPLRLGDLANLDDGLVGYLIESDNSFYSPAAPSGRQNGVVKPSPRTIELALNDTVKTVTLLVDPRAPIHATTAVLPVESLAIPPDQYAGAMRALAMTFFTAPILRETGGLTIPLPQETGYVWSWVGASSPVPLKANAADEFAAYGYSPQTLLEGFLKLTPVPAPPARRR